MRGQKGTEGERERGSETTQTEHHLNKS